MGMIGYGLILLIVAIVVALVARHLRVPYSVGLVIAGVGLALAKVQIGIGLTPQFFLYVLLPPLLFESAINISWRELRRDLLPVLMLAVCGVVISALFTAFGISLLLAWPLSSALIFGALIAATDPVSIIALFRDIGVTGRPRLLLESESLLNDATAAVLFSLMLGFAHASGGLASGAIFQSLALSVGGAVAIGACCGALASWIATPTQDRLIETALTAVTAYGSFLWAQSIGTSGVLACVVAGLIVANAGAARRAPRVRPFSERGYAFMLDFWQFIAFLAESIIFLLIGLREAAVPFAAFGWLALFLVVALTLAARALSVYPISALFSRTSMRISRNEQHLLWWGGLRGALAVALSLSLPDTLPLHDEIQTATFAVVAFSVLVQGLTMPRLLKVLRLA